MTSSLWTVIAAQRALVRDAEGRGAAGAALYRTAFDVVEQAALADAKRTLADPRASPELRSLAADFVERTETALKTAMRVDEHLLALARGWECRTCQGEVPRAAAVSGIMGGRAAVKLAIICQACGQSTPATTEGHKHFDQVFGPLVSPTWNPEAHGFLWDRR